MYILTLNSYLTGNTVLATNTSLLTCTVETAAGSHNTNKTCYKMQSILMLNRMINIAINVLHTDRKLL
jgi:hypothetical protein